MSRHFNQISHGRSARRLLEERRQREEMGDEAYEKQASYTDNREFVIFGIVFMIVMAAIAFGINLFE